MARDDARSEQAVDGDEARSLLANGSTDHDDNIVLSKIRSRSPRPPNPPPLIPPLPRRQSSLAQPRPDGTPRTPNRVRFDIHPHPASQGAPRSNGHLDQTWIQEEDYLDEESGGRGNGNAQRLPLLTDIEAPSVTLAADIDFQPEDLLESARPKSGMRSAFMNMANSIMYVRDTPQRNYKHSDSTQRRRHHRATLCLSASWPIHRHPPPRSPYSHRGLDDPTHRYQFETQRRELLSSNNGTLFWKVRFGSNQCSAMGIVRVENIQMLALITDG